MGPLATMQETLRLNNEKQYLLGFYLLCEGDYYSNVTKNVGPRIRVCEV